MNRRILDKIIGQVEAKQIDNKIKKGLPYVPSKEELDASKARDRKVKIAIVLALGVISFASLRMFRD